MSAPAMDARLAPPTASGTRASHSAPAPERGPDATAAAGERALSSDLLAALAQVESRFPVLQWRVGGIDVWPLVRLRWVFAEWARLYAAPAAEGSGRPSTRERLAQIARARLLPMARQRLAERRTDRADPEGRDAGGIARDLVFLSDGISFAQLGGRWVERFCDPIRAQATALGLSSTMWTPGRRLHAPRYSPSRFIQSTLDVANVSGALAARAGDGRAELPARDEVARWLAERGFGVASIAPARIRSDALRLRAIARRHERALRQARPRLAFTVGYYSIEGMAFVLACRTCGVPTVDIQHGMQAEMHPAYAAWPAPARDGCHALLPDRFWMWSGWEEGVVSRWSAPTHHAAIVGGNPWVEVWRRDPPWPGTAEAIERAAQLKAASGGRPVVLVTLQYGLAEEEQITPLASLLREAGARFVFWVRLHPVMLDRREELRQRLAAAGVQFEIDACTDLPLPALLPQVAVHMTHSSSTAIEAAQFGRRTVVTSDYGAEMYRPLIEDGSVVVDTGPAATVLATLARLAERPPGAAGTPAAASGRGALLSLLADVASPRWTP
jgi:hypothetical protein